KLLSAPALSRMPVVHACRLLLSMRLSSPMPTVIPVTKLPTRFPETVLRRPVMLMPVVVTPPVLLMEQSAIVQSLLQRVPVTESAEQVIAQLRIRQPSSTLIPVELTDTADTVHPATVHPFPASSVPTGPPVDIPRTA